MVNLLDRILGSTGQERTAALRDLGRRAEYYVPPELRGILGFAAEMTPSETLNRAAVAGGEMLAPGRTPMQRVGSAGRMLSETAGVAAPIAAGPRSGMTAAQSLQEGLLGFSMAADDAGRRFVERMNQPGPVPTMYSNPVGRAAGDGIEATLRAKYPDAKIYISGDASRGYTLSQIELPKNMRNSGVGSNIMQDFVSMADAQGAKINLTPSKAFGGSVARLKDFYKRFGFVENKGKNKDFSTRETMYREPSAPNLPAPRNEAEAMAKQVLEMRAAGRAGDVTEEMMAATDPQYMFANTPLPMDYESRMARARELGSLDDQYHATTADFQAFMPSETGLSGRGIYTGDYPTDIADYATKGGSNQGLNVIPLLAPAGSRYARNIDWQRTLDADTEFPYNATAEETIAGFKRAADTMSQQGYAGVHNQAGERVTFNPSDLRSRFARFDPAFAHLRNLSAGVGGLGLLSGLYSQEDTQ